MDKQDEIDNLRRHVSLLQEENQQLLDEIAVLRYRLARAGVVDEPRGEDQNAPKDTP